MSKKSSSVTTTTTTTTTATSPPLLTKKRSRKFSRSKFGCSNCRLKKKKCDERKPRCTACERIDVECVSPPLQIFKFSYQTSTSPKLKKRIEISTPPPTTLPAPITTTMTNAQTAMNPGSNFPNGKKEQATMISFLLNDDD